MSSPVVGQHYPAAAADFLSWFRLDVDCRDYLEWLRWSEGFVCTVDDCGGGGWRLGDGRFMCAECGARTSVTAGTIFDRTRTPLTVWFHACWMFATQKNGVSALSLQKALEISSYETAWAMLHRLRSVAARPGRERLTGTVEMDETYIGGHEPWLRGGRQKGKKVMVGIAVETHHRNGFGRARAAVLPSAKTVDLRSFITDHIEPGSIVVTDGLNAYWRATVGYRHQPIVGATVELPGVHRVASLIKRWLASTHQGSVDEAHLPGYLNEFVFRFNRRTARHRGLLFLRLLELAVAHDPIRRADLAHTHDRPRQRPPVSPGRGGHPTSVERASANRPWRQSPEVLTAEQD
jgi:transposase-like protein